MVNDMFKFEDIISLDNLLTLMDKMGSTNLGSLEVSGEDFTIKLAAKDNIVTVTSGATSATLASEPVTQTPPAPAAPAEITGNLVKSPIVGTFYSAAAPDKPPFVTVGSRVKKGDVLFVIESMKLMNEIQSEFDGEVVDIKVQNAQAVEYGQPIMIIR